MAETHPERAEVNARIVYWGIEGSGKSTNLRTIHAKLRPDHRGRLEQVPTRLDPTAAYDRLPIELGEIAGVRTRIQIVAVPGGAEHGPTRKQLLDRVDGVVLVVDARRQRIDENVAAFEELRSTLAAYGRSLEEVPLVVQYNKQDLSDPFVLEELHRKLDVRGAAVFEAVASEGSGVLQTLTTISKRVVRTLREAGTLDAARSHGASSPPAQALGGVRPSAIDPSATNPALAVTAPTSPPPDLEAAALDAGDELEYDERDVAVHRAQGLLDASWPEVEAEVTGPIPSRAANWRIVRAEPARQTGPQRLVVPLALADPEGRELRFELAISIGALLDD